MKVTLHFFFTIVIALLLVNILNATTYTATTTGAWSASGTWDANGVPDGTGTGDVIINDGVTVTVDGNFTINNLSIGQGGAGATLQTSKTVSNTMVVNGSIAILANSTFKVQTNTTGGNGLAHPLSLKGNLTHNGASLDFRNGTSGTTLSVINLTLSGSTDQTLTVNGAYSATNGDFNAVTINKPSGKVVLGSNIILNGGSSTGAAICNSTMTFVNGIIETGNYIWICQTSTEAQVVGYSSLSYVKGALGRGISNSGASSKYFPVGDANGYRLFNLHATTGGTTTGHYAIVKCIPGDANTGSSSFSGFIDRVSKVRYYQVGYSNSIAGAASMSFDLFKVSYGADDGVIAGNQNLRVAYSTNGRATWTMIPQSVPHTTVIAVSDPQTMITPDALVSPVTLAGSGLGNLYVALADSTNAENPLPVELSSFASAVNGRNITLNWETKTEKNSNKFEIERFVNQTWDNVASVKASVLSNSPKQYSFTDKNLQSGKYQFRLKMVDNDGSFSYSKIVEAEISIPQKFELNQNYPNPFNPTTKIEYSLPDNGFVKLQIYSVTGQLVKSLVNENQQAGYYTINFAGNDLSSGIYIYKLSVNNNSLVKKMTLLK